MRLELSPLAETDLEAIGDYIAIDNPGNALRFIQDLRDQCRKITKAPMAYVARPELGEQCDGLFAFWRGTSRRKSR